MILKNDFYSITSLSDNNGSIVASLQLNPSHAIFKGHFPDQPIVPGVCMVQMVKEIVETAFGKSLMLKTADHLKFLSMVNPLETTGLDASIIYTHDAGDNISVTATLIKNETVCLKMRATFIVSV